MISAVAAKYNIHPQTLRLYEREGLLKPSRTEGNTRLYSDEDLQELETILALTRDLGVNLAGVEIILNMRRKMGRMQHEVNEFMEYVKRELQRGLGDWEQRLNTALVPAAPAIWSAKNQTGARGRQSVAGQSVVDCALPWRARGVTERVGSASSGMARAWSSAARAGRSASPPN
jgi:MerR family transcriptional regulator/heat shock protein HspR